MHKFKFVDLLTLLFACFSLLLFGCQKVNEENGDVNSKFASYTPTEKDGAPQGVKLTKFKEVTPVKTSLSRYGNPATYKVDGKTYNVLLSADGYHTRGVASWYGTKFHSKLTSSGEVYDMYALTAAHKTLPLPTYIKVKNLDNGKIAVIKVNDRGPFHKDRVLDLSYGAANKLGIFPKGTARVEIEAIDTQDKAAKYYLQAGAFSSNDSALKLKEAIEKVSPKMVFISREKQKFLVRIGPFIDKNMSDKIKKTLINKGFSGVFSMIM